MEWLWYWASKRRRQLVEGSHPLQKRGELHPSRSRPQSRQRRLGGRHSYIDFLSVSTRILTMQIIAVILREPSKNSLWHAEMARRRSRWGRCYLWMAGIEMTPTPAAAAEGSDVRHRASGNPPVPGAWQGQIYLNSSSRISG